MLNTSGQLGDSVYEHPGQLNLFPEFQATYLCNKYTENDKNLYKSVQNMLTVKYMGIIVYIYGKIFAIIWEFYKFIALVPLCYTFANLCWTPNLSIFHQLPSILTNNFARACMCVYIQVHFLSDFQHRYDAYLLLVVTK